MIYITLLAKQETLNTLYLDDYFDYFSEIITAKVRLF